MLVLRLWSFNSMNHYHIIRNIGSGASGSVLLVRERNSGHWYSIKKWCIDSKEKQQDVINEV